MLDKRKFNHCKILDEMDDDNRKYWFDFKQQKFLHNIDTFYYSVKLNHDFTKNSDEDEMEEEDFNVSNFRKFFKNEYSKQRQQGDWDVCTPIYIPGFDMLLNLRPFTFARIYNINIECPDYFDIFIAPQVPNLETCEIVVQIRSYMLWMYGIYESFERSYKAVEMLANKFGLDIAFAQENRIDYCWHSNYLSNPEKFFNIENFAKMRVSRIRSATYHVDFYGNESHEIDYLRLGQRGKKIFIRIYLKSKEVVEMGYKAFFFKIWLFNGLINRYDNYCLEECYKRKNWQYLDYARLEYYLEFGRNKFEKAKCRNILAKKEMDWDELHTYADMLTPKINLVMNVEYQTMRKSTKTYCLLPLRDNTAKTTCKRIYDYLDNRRLIIDYLTSKELRLVEPAGDVNKSRRDYCKFWKALRSTKLVDIKVKKNDLKLVREYTRKLNAEILKKRILNSTVTLGIYNRGLNEDNPIMDCVQALCQLNDNDIANMRLYKKKKSRQFNVEELAGTVQAKKDISFSIINNSTGEVYDDYIPEEL